MCLGVPGKIIEISKDGVGRAVVGAVEIPVNFHLTPEAVIGDFVMIHAGSALEVMNAGQAVATLAVLKAADRREGRSEALLAEIRDLAADLGQTIIMEVCGSHTTAIGRSGVRQRLPENVELISGPGCPVCVTPVGEINIAIELAQSGRAAIATFGDMLRVPGSIRSLEEARSRGADVTVVYSPEQAINMARARSDEVCFLAVGFETTAPLIAAAVKSAANDGVDNFSVLVNHRLVPPALEAVLSDPEAKIDGLICPGHVSTVIGVEPYERLVEEYGVPCAVSGFETLDVLEATAMILKQLRSGVPRADNQYSRTVSYHGSRPAQREIADIFDVVDGGWRGLGVIKDSALALKPEYRSFDAAFKFGLEPVEQPEPPGCLCGEILGGRSKPIDCPLLGSACMPEHPVGPCMVSSEGSCRAAYIYG